MAKKKCKRCQQIRIFAIFFALAGILLMLMMTKAKAQVYKYTDDQGRKIFVGSPSQIPPQYRDQVVIVKPSGEVSNSSSFSSSNEKAASSLKSRGAIRRLETYIRSMQTQIQVNGNRVLVPVTVSYEGQDANVRMLMDTGASGTVFHRDALAKLNPTSEKAGYAKVAGGGLIKVGSISFDWIKVGPFRAEAINSFVIDNKAPGSGYDGLLGMDFLMNVDYELDLANQVIIWNPKKYKAAQVQLEELRSAPKQSVKK